MKNLGLTALVAAVFGLAGAAAFHFIIPANGIALQPPQQPAPYTPASHTSSHVVSNEAFVKASAVASPAVVFIKTVSANTNMYSWFFNQGSAASSGSGVIFSSDGYIITNNHVIQNAQTIEVIHLKKTYTAKLVGTDPGTDIAIIKIDATGLPGIPLGSSAAVQVGEWVLAVGNPFNLSTTVTAGIVSAKARDIGVVSDIFPIESFIQTDAAINPGNSGGALVNLDGKLIGINTAILSRTGQYAGYGFAVPVDIVKKVASDIIKYGIVQKAYVGAEVTDLNTDLANKYNNSDVTGVLLSSVWQGWAAHKAGLLPGDVITHVDGVAVDSKAVFDELISYHRPGDDITIAYKRNSKEYQATLKALNADAGTDMLTREIYNSVGLGADLESVLQLEKLKFKITGGVRIVTLKAGTLQKLGLEQGFIITAINDTPVSTPEEAEDLLRSPKGRIVVQGVSKNGVKGYYSSYLY